MDVPEESSQKSIYDLPPIENGGVISRTGLTFQDHVAVSFCVEMLAKPELKEIWCETQDDITLIWSNKGGTEVEFAQVKGSEFDHLWSVAELCRRAKTSNNPIGLGTSVLEKSLAYDRCAEPCCFRLVTSWETNKDLSILKYPLSSPARFNPSMDLETLGKQVSVYVSDFRSPNGNDYAFWLSRALWQIEPSSASLALGSVQAIQDYAYGMGINLPAATIKDSVYPKIVERVREAAEADWWVNKSAKAIERDPFIVWLQTIISQLELPNVVIAGQDLTLKMEAALLPSDYINTAHEQRRRYRQEMLSPHYLDVSDRELAVGEVYAELDYLRTCLDSGQFDEGVTFYGICLDRIKVLQQSLKTKVKPPLFFLFGCMHDITDRCGHRYRRIAV